MFGRLAAQGLAGALALLLAGCAAYSGAGLQPGVGQDEIRTVMGPPHRVWEDAAGGTSWEYPRGPEGRQTFMARLGADGRLVRVDQVLAEDFFAQVVAGMTREAVERTLGRPYSVQRFPRMREEVWGWRWTQANVWSMCFWAHFGDDGRLLRSSMGVEHSPGDSWPLRTC